MAFVKHLVPILISWTEVMPKVAQPRPAAHPETNKILARKWAKLEQLASRMMGRLIGPEAMATGRGPEIFEPSWKDIRLLGRLGNAFQRCPDTAKTIIDFNGKVFAVLCALDEHGRWRADTDTRNPADELRASFQNLVKAGDRMFRRRLLPWK